VDRPTEAVTFLVRVVAPHFVAGLVIDARTERCVDAAPILAWCVGRASLELRQYFDSKGWNTERLEE
jgi:hypothetical protein